MKVLVLGDVIVDRYTYGKALGLSAETPTVVARWEREETFVGGAGLVARNLVRLGANVTLIYVNGPAGPNFFNVARAFDDSSDPIVGLEKMRLDDRFVMLPGFNVVQKRRYFVDGCKLLQFDVLNEGEHDAASESVLIDHDLSAGSLGGYDAVLACDNRHGFFDEPVARALVERCSDAGVSLYVDSQVSQKRSNHEWYAGCRAMFMNERELLSVAEQRGLLFSSERPVFDVADALARELRCGIVLKMGKDGAAICGDVKFPRWREKDRRVAGRTVKVVDTCGAGDAFAAAFVFSQGDLDFANRWAALSTTYSGTRVPEWRDLE